MLLLTVVLLLPWLPSFLAQDFSIPQQWTNTSSVVPRNDSIQRAQGVLDSLVGYYQSDTGDVKDLFNVQNANLFSAIAIHDLVSASSTNRVDLTNRFSKKMAKLNPIVNAFTTCIDQLAWGLTGIYGYRAYQDVIFLNNAIAIWEAMTPWVITEAHAISGSHPLKSSPLQSQCNNASVAGGIFWNISNKTNLTVGSGAEGFYMALSAYLYEIMKNETYQAAASMSHKFTQSQLLSNISTCSGCARDMISLDDCHYPNKLILNCNTGLYIEGLTVLGHTSNDTELLDIADQLSVIAVKSSQWSNPSGFSIGPPSDVRNDGYGTPTFRAMLIRALHEHWSRSQPDSDIARLIGAYLLLQYNSLLEFGQYPGKPWYSPSWTGPPVPHLVLWGQQGAIDLMNSAISLSVDPSISDSPGPTGTGETSMSHRKPLALGPIIGGVTGGVVFLGVIIAVIVVIRLRRRNGTVSRAQILDHSAFTGGRILGESFQPAPPLPSATAPRGRQWLNTQHHIEPFSASPHADPSSSNIGPPPRYKEVVQ